MSKKKILLVNGQSVEGQEAVMKAKKCKRKSAFCLVDIPFEIDMQIFKIYQDGVPHKLNHIFKVVCLKRVCDKLQSGGLQEHPDSCYVGEGIMEESKEIHSFRKLTQSSIFVSLLFRTKGGAAASGAAGSHDGAQ